MTIYIGVCVALFGLLIGSFLNVCIFRIPEKQSIAFPPSHCMNCNHKLGVLDLFPVFSWLFLGGKCRYCKAKISVQYPIVEFINAAFYLYGFYKFGLSLQFVFFALLCSLLLVLTLIDFKYFILPNILVLIVFILGILYMLLVKKQYLDSLWGVLAGGGFFLLLMLVTRGNMGGGDIKLMAALGVWLGLKGTVMTMLFAFVIGALASVIVLIKNGGGRKTMIPFGPFISAGTIISLCWCEDIIAWYLSFFEYL